MTSNYWEDVVYADRPLSGLERSDMSNAFRWLDRHFPKRGSKIDWSRVPGRHVHWEIHDDEQLASAAAREVCRRSSVGSRVEHVGDGLSPYGVLLGEDNVQEIVITLLEIPEHHYFLARDRSWIVVATTEGDLDIVDELPFSMEE